jgi:hypothetical protein
LKLAKCQNYIYSIGSVGSENASNLTLIKKTIGVVVVQAEEHTLFMKNYLDKSKMVRKKMLSRIWGSGIPLN